MCFSKDVEGLFPVHSSMYHVLGNSSTVFAHSSTIHTIARREQRYNQFVLLIVYTGRNDITEHGPQPHRTERHAS